MKKIMILLIFLSYLPTVVFADEQQPQITKIEVVDKIDFTAPEKDECFIATAAYGSKFEPHVATLRQFRDEILLPNKMGRTFVDFYYKHSPPIADFIRNSEILKQIVRLVLLPFVAIAYVSLNTTTYLGLLSILILVGYFIKRRHLT